MDGLISQYIETGFDLFSAVAAMPGSNDWILETNTGFGNAGQYGIRSMTLTEDGTKMLIGSATAAAELGCIVFESTAISRDRMKVLKPERRVYNATHVKEFMCKQYGSKGFAEIGSMCDEI